MASIRPVPLRQIRYVKAAFHWTGVAVSERIYIWPIAQKRGSSPLKGIPTLLLLISSYSFWRNGADPTLCHSQRGLGLRIVYRHLPVRLYDRSCSIACQPLKAIAGKSLDTEPPATESPKNRQSQLSAHPPEWFAPSAEARFQVFGGFLKPYFSNKSVR